LAFGILDDTAFNTLNISSSIVTQAFFGCFGLIGDLVIPNTITSINDQAFSGCIGITSLNLTKYSDTCSLTIKVGCFDGCSSLTSIAACYASEPMYKLMSSFSGVNSTGTVRNTSTTGYNSSNLLIFLKTYCNLPSGWTTA
jgi:hypothetical protein